MIDDESNHQLVVSNDDNNKTIVAYNSKIKQKILEEEEYLAVLDKIVERDFYPELTKLKLRTEYIDALDSNNVEKLRRIQIQLEQVTPNVSQKTVAATPQGFDTPFDEESGKIGEEDISNTKDEKGNDNLTLDRFLAKNTSEDNASFEKIMEVTRAKHREKHAWLFEQQQELHQRLDASKALPSTIEGQMKAIESKPNNVDTWKYEAKNALMYVPEGVELSAEEIIKTKGKKEKQICHENTRFKSNPFQTVTDQLVKASQEQANLKKAVGKIGVDGKLEDINTVDGETPGVRSYQFIGTPSMTPGAGVDASPLMTWGEIEGTPLRIDATPAPSFKIAEPPRREQLAHSLVEKASKQHREKRKKAMAAAHASLVSPRYTPKGNTLASDRLSLLSPAAQKLVKSSVRLNTGDSSLRASYSPSPFHAKRTPGTRSAHFKTPSTGVKTPLSIHRDVSSITDDLLQLPNT